MENLGHGHSEINKKKEDELAEEKYFESLYGVSKQRMNEAAAYDAHLKAMTEQPEPHPLDFLSQEKAAADYAAQQELEKKEQEREKKEHQEHMESPEVRKLMFYASQINEARYERDKYVSELKAKYDKLQAEGSLDSSISLEQYLINNPGLRRIEDAILAKEDLLNDRLIDHEGDPNFTDSVVNEIMDSTVPRYKVVDTVVVPELNKSESLRAKAQETTSKAEKIAEKYESSLKDIDDYLKEANRADISPNRRQSLLERIKRSPFARKAIKFVACLMAVVSVSSAIARPVGANNDPGASQVNYETSIDVGDAANSIVDGTSDSVTLEEESSSKEKTSTEESSERHSYSKSRSVEKTHSEYDYVVTEQPSVEQSSPTVTVSEEVYYEPGPTFTRSYTVESSSVNHAPSVTNPSAERQYNKSEHSYSYEDHRDGDPIYYDQEYQDEAARRLEHPDSQLGNIEAETAIESYYNYIEANYRNIDVLAGTATYLESKFGATFTDPDGQPTKLLDAEQSAQFYLNLQNNPEYRGKIYDLVKRCYLDKIKLDSLKLIELGDHTRSSIYKVKDATGSKFIAIDPDGVNDTGKIGLSFTFETEGEIWGNIKKIEVAVVKLLCGQGEGEELKVMSTTIFITNPGSRKRVVRRKEIIPPPPPPPTQHTKHHVEDGEKIQEQEDEEHEVTKRKRETEKEENRKKKLKIRRGLEAKDPTQDINANPNLPDNIQMGSDRVDSGGYQASEDATQDTYTPPPETQPNTTTDNTESAQDLNNKVNELNRSYENLPDESRSTLTNNETGVGEVNKSYENVAQTAEDIVTSNTNTSTNAETGNTETTPPSNNANTDNGTGADSGAGNTETTSPSNVTNTGTVDASE